MARPFLGKAYPKRSTLAMRFYDRKWDIERCLTEPVRG